MRDLFVGAIFVENHQTRQAEPCSLIINERIEPLNGGMSEDIPAPSDYTSALLTLSS